MSRLSPDGANPGATGFGAVANVSLDILLVPAHGAAGAAGASGAVGGAVAGRGRAGR